MNFAHWHLLLNHLPVLGTAFGVVLLLLATWRKSDELKRLSLWVFVLAAVAAIPAYLTGEPAEGMIEHMPNVAENLIERHEEWALISLLATGLTGLAALAGWFAYRRAEHLPNWLTSGALVLALTTSTLMGWTANLGGQIRHPEIATALNSTNQSNAQPNQSPNPEKSGKESKEKHDDDD